MVSTGNYFANGNDGREGGSNEREGGISNPEDV
jgi:hypothetical protein